MRHPRQKGHDYAEGRSACEAHKGGLGGVGLVFVNRNEGEKGRKWTIYTSHGWIPPWTKSI